MKKEGLENLTVTRHLEENQKKVARKLFDNFNCRTSTRKSCENNKRQKAVDSYAHPNDGQIQHIKKSQKN